MPEVIWIKVDDTLTVGLPVGTAFLDTELRAPWEYHGYPEFAWFPRKCRNGQVRWFCWLERHGDGTYTNCRAS